MSLGNHDFMSKIVKLPRREDRCPSPGRLEVEVESDGRAEKDKGDWLVKEPCPIGVVVVEVLAKPFGPWENHE